MKTLILVIILIGIFGFHGTPVSRQSDEEAKLRHFKKVLWKKAYRDQDTTLLNRLLADEFQVIFANGNWSDKNRELEYIKKNKPNYDSFEYEIKRLDIYKNGTAIIAGEGHVIGKNDGGPYEYKYQSSNVLIKRDEVWKAVSSHVSGVNYLKGGNQARSTEKTK